MTFTLKDDIERLQGEINKRASSVRTESQRGIYFLLDSEAIVYVGQSLDVLSRIRAHWNQREWRQRRFTRAAVILIPEHEKEVTLGEAERFFIDAFLPKYNGDATTRMMRRANERSKGHTENIWCPQARPEFRLWLAGAIVQSVAQRPVRHQVPNLPLEVRRRAMAVLANIR